MFVCIDLKSFYASVECVLRGLDPLDANLVVADASRTEKTICLAVSPSLKAQGVPGRPRLFEVLQITGECNRERRLKIHHRPFSGKSVSAAELAADPFLELDFITAPPQMAKYMAVSTQIYEIYLRYVSSEDIHVYSIDEVFIDVSGYLMLYKCTAHELAMRMIRDVLRETGITATAGVGTNMYLAKVAMDIVAKKMPPDKDGVRIAELDEISYREKLWEHRPLTDFWRIGRGIARRLESNYMYTMGDIALRSECDENGLYKLFGKNAELIIDHAWGYEPCTMAAIKSYRTSNHSLSTGQVLSCGYSFDKARIIIHEMADQLALDLVRKGVVCDQVGISVSYDHTSNVSEYSGEFCTDHYGKKVPKPVNGTRNLGRQTSSAGMIISAVLDIYDSITDPALLVRRLNVTANHVVSEKNAEKPPLLQYSLFDDIEALEARQKTEEEKFEKEMKIQKTLVELKERFGKNAVMKAMNYQEGATAIERNGQVGGHRA